MINKDLFLNWMAEIVKKNAYNAKTNARVGRKVEGIRNIQIL